MKRILKGLNPSLSDVTVILDVSSISYKPNRQGSGRHRIMYSKCVGHGLLAVRKEDVRLIFSELDPDGVAARLSRRLERRTNTVPGPNFIWHLDGYDNLRHFDLA